ncbi:hypothetical protein SAMN06265795_12832 [Noviherbaspirillum humi]|uniref:N-acetyltransferase domain-containing protein n=1 Tax=Noviherbaspirillum humi TaxID=1688639 RepID=A0A239M110_9BURK|nr:GNAT family N-acetyltransferase [Noviherbaspirillum humi]SNT35654.1 hypothetical protein SAMN06265795_12832 [Noviherbaspirillum humi]
MQDSTQIDEASQAAPVPCARWDGFEICFEGYGWALPRPGAMMAGEENGRFADICGDDIQGIADTGWQFLAEPVCFTAVADGKVTACAWAAPMQTEDGGVGCNLSYAVDADHEGRGLAKLLTCLAFLACDQLHPEMDFANIESRADNLPSAALARSLGFLHCPEEDFSMPVAGGNEVDFLCFRIDTGALRAASHQALENRNLHGLLALIRANTPASTTHESNADGTP